jgi:hypothetical protein
MTKVSSSDQLVLKVKGGHIGMKTGSGAQKYTWPHIDSCCLGQRLDAQRHQSCPGQVRSRRIGVGSRPHCIA